MFAGLGRLFRNRRRTLFRVRLLRIVVLPFLLVLVGATTVVGQGSGARVALLVANGKYPEAAAAASRTAQKDAELLAAELALNGFDVSLKADIGKRDMQTAFDAFLAKITPGSVAILYFNGVGLQVARQTYLIPVDAEIWTEADVRREGINVDAVVGEMQKRGATVKIVILDAVHGNPFEKRFRANAAGLAGLDAPEGTLLVYAVGPNKVGKPGNGQVSLFMDELVKEIRTPDISAEEALTHTRIGVSRASNGAQVPWVASSLVDPFYFAQTTPTAPAEKPPTPVASPSVARVEPPSRALPPSPQQEKSSPPLPLKADVPPPPSPPGAPKVESENPPQPPKTSAPPAEAPPSAPGPSRTPAPVAGNDNPPANPPSVASPTFQPPQLRPTRQPQRRRSGGRGRPMPTRPAQVPTRPKPTEAPREPPQSPAEAPKPVTPSTTAPVIKVGSVFGDCTGCPEMVVLAAGSYQMGSGTTPFDRPVHRVTLLKPFAIGRAEVTFTEWELCAAEGGCKYRPDNQGAGGQNPVTNVSWYDTKDYVAWLSKKTGRTYRLPTEAEWEYAAHGGTTTAFAWGADVGTNNANCAGCGTSGASGGTLPVRRFAPNGFGIYDMAGNAAEWVEDCWSLTYRGAPQDGSAVQGNNCGERVLRGGSFDSAAAYVKPSARFRYDADVRYPGNGFRVVLELP